MLQREDVGSIAAMLDGARVSVVVPAHDEARLIARTLASIPAFVDLIVVVDDGSRDDTAREVEAIRDPRVVLVRHAQNLGVGAALRTGYARAFAAGADIVAVMAGDAQMHPDDLADLLAPIVRGEADYAKGDRLSHPEVRARMPLQRYVGNRALTALTRLSTGLDVRDSQCGYTALARAAAPQLALQDLWPSYGYPNDLLSRAATAGLRVKDVTVRPVYGSEVSGIRGRHLVTAFPIVLARCFARRVRAVVSRRSATESAAVPRVGLSAAG